jgi:hypothetical protein
VRTLAGQTVTISFYAKADTNISITPRLAQNFGTGGSPSTTVGVNGPLQNITTSWQKFEVTLTTGSLSGKTIGTDGNDSLELILNLPQASTYIFDLAQVQVEKGVVATDFEIRPIEQEIALCQRYYEKSYNLTVDPGTISQAGEVRFIQGGTSSQFLGGPFQFQVRKRATPSMIIYSPGTGATGNAYNRSTLADIAASPHPSGEYGSGYNAANVAVANNQNINAHFTADAEL